MLHFKKSILLFLISTFQSMLGLSQDWANLNKYREDNEKVGLPSFDEKRIVFMGNSITEGWKHIYPEFFEGKPYINRGIGGQTTPQMLVRFRQDVIHLKPTVVVILAGVNDIAGNTGPSSLEMIIDNITSMSEIAQANGIKVILSSVLPAYRFSWKPEINPIEPIEKLNTLIKNYANQQGFVYLDYYSAMVDERKGLQKQFSDDEVHPNLVGYKVMAPLCEEAIAKALDK